MERFWFNIQHRLNAITCHSTCLLYDERHRRTFVQQTQLQENQEKTRKPLGQGDKIFS